MTNCKNSRICAICSRFYSYKHQITIQIHGRIISYNTFLDKKDIATFKYFCNIQIRGTKNYSFELDSAQICVIAVFLDTYFD